MDSIQRQLSQSSPVGLRLSGTNLEHAGDHNQRVTLHAIRLKGPITRSELAEITGLTAPTVANITKRLLDEGMIGVAGRSQGARGQPATRLVINAESHFSIGLNIDRDHITMVVLDFEGNVRARASREIDFALPSAVRSFYQKYFWKLLEEASVEGSRVIGVGVALPDDLGSIDLPHRPQAYSEWNGVSVANLLSEPLSLPVFVENDAAAAAMGELQFGLGHSHSSFFYILVSSALGGGPVMDGAYFRGATGRSGEIGFLTVYSDKADKDQLQKIVSLSGLAARLESEGVKLASVRTSARLGRKVGAIIDDWLETAARALVEPLAAINCLINPGAILIGGRLPSELVDRLAARVNDLMGQRAGVLPSIAPVARAALSEDAPAVGAAILPFSHFLLPTPNSSLKPGGISSGSRMTARGLVV
jgi:predicted NBD/HSP70 family sugar kinase